MPLKRSTLRTGLYAAPRSVGSTKKACLSLHAFCFSLDMLNEAKHPHRTGFLAGARNDTLGFVMLNGAQRSEASTSHWIPRSGSE